MTRSKSIVLIDDNSVTNYLHRAMINDLDLGYEIVTCENGKLGLDFLESGFQDQSVPKLILVDLNMPVMDGFEFIENYKARHYNELYPTILAVVTTSTNPRDMERIKDLGITSCLAKPLKKDQIMKLLENAPEKLETGTAE
jgi:CheY-like chemotaxis protein